MVVMGTGTMAKTMDEGTVPEPDSKNLIQFWMDEWRENAKATLERKKILRIWFREYRIVNFCDRQQTSRQQSGQDIVYVEWLCIERWKCVKNNAHCVWWP